MELFKLLQLYFFSEFDFDFKRLTLWTRILAFVYHVYRFLLPLVSLCQLD